MKKNKILFVGYYGFKNTGDDMFGLISSWGADYYWDISQTSLLSKQGAYSNRVPIKFALSKNKYFKGQYILENYYEIFNSEYIIFAGGSILNSKPKGKTSPKNLISFLAKSQKLNIGGIGVSLGPFKSDKDFEYIKEILQYFKFLVLRDKTSYNLALNMDLPYRPVLGADLAFLLPKFISLSDYSINKNSNRLKNKKTIGISLCHYERYITSGDINNENRREDKIFELFNILKNDNNIEFNFFIINGHHKTGDRDITDEFIKKLSLKKERYKLIDYNPDTIGVISKLVECDLIFSVRLHSAIFSATQNIPSLLVEYHQKCADYLDDIGVADKWRIGDMNMRVEKIILKMYSILEQKSENFYSRKNKLIKLAEKNFIDESVLNMFSKSKIKEK